MTRFISRVAASAAAGVLVASLAFANVPVPDLSTIPTCLPISANGGLTYQVRIVGSGGPILASRVNVLFSTIGDSLVCWCTATGPGYIAGSPHSFFANTNGAGIASFNLFGGGCIEKGLTGITGTATNNYAAEVFADFVKMGEVGTVSPDAVDNGGVLPTGTPRWNPSAGCQTALGDAVKHTTPLSNATYSWCTDINCDKAVTLGDATLLTPFLSNAISCAGNAGQ